MQKCFLVSNKETSVASYLSHRSIMEVTEEHRSLKEVDLEKLQIVDVDKFLYIYYQTDDADLSFRSDMNTLRALMASAFFHVTEVQFILVNTENPLLEDLVYSALRDSGMPRSKIEILHHTGSLMLADVGKYVSGSAIGQTTSSSYRDVYIREADKEERARYENKKTDITSILPVLTDMASLYAQRAGVEAISAGIQVEEGATQPQLIENFSKINKRVSTINDAFIISGERWTSPERAVNYLVEYLRKVGQRALIINLNPMVDIEKTVGECTQLSLLEIKTAMTPENQMSTLNARFDQIGYIIEMYQNVKGVDHYIFFVSQEDYYRGCRIMNQMFNVVNKIFIAHYTEESVKLYINASTHSTALFLSFEHFDTDFDLHQFKDQLEGTIVAKFPTSNVDYNEFWIYSTGEGNKDE